MTGWGGGWRLRRQRDVPEEDGEGGGGEEGYHVLPERVEDEEGMSMLKKSDRSDWFPCPWMLVRSSSNHPRPYLSNHVHGTGGDWIRYGTLSTLEK